MFRTREPSTPAPALHPSARALSLLVESMALHAVEDPDVEIDPFRNSVRSLGSRAERVTNEQLLLVAGEMIGALRAYNQQVEQAVSQRESEWRAFCMTLLNTNTLLRSAIGSNTKIEGLRSEIGAASQVRNLRDIRSQVAGHLESIEAMAALRSRNPADPDGDLSSAEIDRLTGLPDRAAAGRTIAKLLEVNETFHPVVVSVEKLESINSRFGFKAGDSLLLLVSQRLSQSLPRDKVFRWRGGSFLLLLKRAGKAEKVRSELQHLDLHRKEYTIQLENKSVLLTVSCTWSLLPVSPQALAETLCMAIDDSVARQGQNVVYEERGRMENQRLATRSGR